MPASSINLTRKVADRSRISESISNRNISPAWRRAPHSQSAKHHTDRDPHKPNTRLRGLHNQEIHATYNLLVTCWTECVVVVTVLRRRGLTRGEDPGVSIRSRSNTRPHDTWVSLNELKGFSFFSTRHLCQYEGHGSRILVLIRWQLQSWGGTWATRAWRRRSARLSAILPAVSMAEELGGGGNKVFVDLGLSGLWQWLFLGDLIPASVVPSGSDSMVSWAPYDSIREPRVENHLILAVAPLREYYDGHSLVLVAGC